MGLGWGGGLAQELGMGKTRAHCGWKERRLACESVPPDTEHQGCQASRPPETLQAKAGCLVTEPQGGFAGSSGQVLLAYLKAQYLVAASGDKGKEGQCGARGQRGAAFLKQSFTF